MERETAILTKLDQSGNVAATLNPTNSEAMSQLKGYNSLLDPQDTSAEFSVYKKLNDFVDAIVKNVNAIAVSGYGLDDTGTTPSGRTFFNPTTGDANAGNISINSEILVSGRNIPISSVAGEAGNNQIAMKIARLANDSTFIDKQNPTEYYSNLLSKIGTLAAEAFERKKYY